MLEQSLPKGLSPLEATRAGAVLKDFVNLSSSFLTLHSAHTSIGNVANKASHTSKARCFLASDPKEESLWLSKHSLNSSLCYPSFPISTGLDSLLSEKS